MMKKATSMILAMLLAFILSGCGGTAESLQEPVPFFYPEKVQEDGSITNVIRAEQREGKAFGDDLELLLTVYLAGPKDPSLYSPFPAHTELSKVTVSDGKVIIRFAESFGELSSLDRTIACACISKTCMEFTGAELVEIFAENTLFDGVESIVISRQNLLTMDNTPITEP